jgi:hypothetical protein
MHGKCHSCGLTEPLDKVMKAKAYLLGAFPL